MISFDDFVKKYNGKFVEIAGSPQNQCVDLANAYIREVLGQPIIEWTNAVDFPLKAGDKYQYILNTPTGIPQKGDLIIWKPSPGHIAIFTEGNVNTFKSFDENFPVGSPCHIQDHNYTNVTGWLRLKPQEPMATITQKELNAIIKARDDNFNNWQAEIIKTKELTTQITTLNGKLTTLQDKITKNKELAQQIING